MGSSTICLLLLLSIFVGKSKDDFVDQHENENDSSLAFSSTRSTTTFRLFEWILSGLLWMSQQSTWLRCQSRLDLDALETLCCTRRRQMCQNHRTFSRWYRIDHSLLIIDKHLFSQVKSTMFVVVSIRSKRCDLKCQLFARMDAGQPLITTSYVLIPSYTWAGSTSLCLFRVWLIDRGMCKPTSLSIVSVMNEMVATQLHVHWPIIPTFSSCVCSLSLPESVPRLMYCFLCDL